ncbi:hypothetical protein PFISCL1PPCAC_10880, partial [Pristionchus fissidentatus]
QVKTMFPYALVHQYIEMSTDQKSIDEFDSIDEKKLIDPIYEDKFCKIYPGKLEIVWYYFPTAKSKTISTKEIKSIYYKKQVFKEDFLVSKGWGQSLSKIWWACDMNRKNLLKQFRQKNGDVVWYNVVIDNGEKTMKGFTNNNIDSFFDALKPFLPESVEIKNEMPDN